MIVIKNLSKKFKGQEVLRGIDLTVPDGQSLIMMGQNGAGKTTLIRCILGEYRPDAGSVLIDGCSPWKDRVEALKNISFVPQLPPPLKFTIGELIDYTAGVCNFDKKKVSDICGLLELDIKPHLSKPFHKLSGGMKQKVLISIALARSGKVVIFDEPTANLDIKGRQRFYELLRESKADKTFIFVSHRLEEFAGLVDRNIELDMGKVVKDEKV